MLARVVLAAAASRTGRSNVRAGLALGAGMGARLDAHRAAAELQAARRGSRIGGGAVGLHHAVRGQAVIFHGDSVGPIHTCPVLATVGRDLHLGGEDATGDATRSQSLATLDFSSLATVAGDVGLEHMGPITEVAFPELAFVGGHLGGCACHSAGGWWPLARAVADGTGRGRGWLDVAHVQGGAEEGCGGAHRHAAQRCQSFVSS